VNELDHDGADELICLISDATNAGWNSVLTLKYEKWLAEISGFAKRWRERKGTS
jgi:hypothetical protein